MAVRKYFSDAEKDEWLELKRLIKFTDGVICQIWFDNDDYKYKGTKPRNVIRLGHQNTLRFIEVPRILISDGTVRITEQWLRLFITASKEHKKIFKGLLFRK